MLRPHDLSPLSQFVFVETNDLHSGKYPILGHFFLDFPFFSELLLFTSPLFFFLVTCDVVYSFPDYCQTFFDKKMETGFVSNYMGHV